MRSDVITMSEGDPDEGPGPTGGRPGPARKAGTTSLMPAGGRLLPLVLLTGCLQLFHNYNSQHVLTSNGCQSMLGVVKQLVKQLEAKQLEAPCETTGGETTGGTLCWKSLPASTPAASIADSTP